MSSEIEIDMAPPAPQIDSSQPIPFQLQFDKPISSQVKFAVWNPEKDLLAMVTEDSKVVLHRFNWQRLWTASPGRLITSLCWRPDGKAVTVGLEDGCIILYDVENGKLLKTIKSHNVSIVSLNWEEDKQNIKDDGDILLTYEDRTTRFFPPPPRIPRMPGLCSGDVGLVDDFDDSVCELSIPSCQRLSILCSGDKAGNICFSIFGMFPIGRINIHEVSISSPIGNKQVIYQMMNASLQKVALSKNLCQLLITSFGSLAEGSFKSSGSPLTTQGGKADIGCRSLDIDESLVGLHCLVLDTSIFGKRRNEIHQVALQASSIDELVEVSRASLSVMHKQWSDAMHMFHEKFAPLSSLITDHGLESNPQEEFLSFLFGARTSPPLHQFLVNVLGESGLKRVSKALSGAGKELHLVLREHLQPAAEIIAFRIAELRGLSRWHARYQGIGLDEKLVDKATEKAGMFLVQIERFLRVLATVLYLFQNFFNWLTRGTRQLMSEHSDQIAHYNSEHVVIFLKFHLDNDLVRQLLESGNSLVEVDFNTMNRVEELEKFGGFSDVKYLERTLAKEFGELVDSLKDAFSMPLTSISQKILCEGFLPLFPSASAMQIPTSVSYNEDATGLGLVDYICFQIPGNTFGISNGIGFIRGITNCFHYGEAGESSSEAVMLHLPNGYHCVDIDIYKDGQIVLLLNEASTSSENLGKSWMIMISSGDLRFSPVSMSTPLNVWKLHKLKEFAVMLNFEDSKRRSIPHLVAMPLAVSASRGVACVFAVRKRALVYILDEDEDEGSEME